MAKNDFFEFHGCKDCFFKAAIYVNNDNKALMIVSQTEGPMCWCSVNPSEPMDLTLKNNKIAIKDWSENDGMDEFLIEKGVIKDTSCDSVCQGMVVISIYELTDFGMSLFNELREK